MKKCLFLIGFVIFPALIFAQCDYSYGIWDTSLSSMPTERYITSAVNHNDSIYFIGGGIPGGGASEYISSVDVYIPATDEWITGVTEIPFPMCSPNACLIDNKIYVVGGLHFADGAPVIFDSVFIYDIRANTWQKGESIPAAVSVFSADTIDGKIYVAGGGTDDWGIVNNVYVYNPLLDEWTEKESMNRTRRASGGKSWNGKLFVFGGYSGDSWSVSNSLEVYEPNKDEWTFLCYANKPRSLMDMAQYDNQLFVFGGIRSYTNTGYNYVNYISRYDLQTNTWLDYHSQGDKFPGNRQFPATVVVDGIFYCFGGFIDGDVQNNVWTYSLKSIRQNIEIYDTVLASENIQIDLTDYFSSGGDEELKYSICQLSGEDVIEASVENAKLLISKSADAGGSSELVVNAYNTTDTISSNAFVVEYSPTGINVNNKNRISVYPNPASNVVAASFYMSEPGMVTLEVFNSLGQVVAIHSFEKLKAGEHQFEWTIEDWKNGIYFTVLKTGKSTVVSKLIIRK